MAHHLLEVSHHVGSGGGLTSATVEILADSIRLVAVGEPEAAEDVTIAFDDYHDLPSINLEQLVAAITFDTLAFVGEVHADAAEYIKATDLTIGGPWDCLDVTKVLDGVPQYSSKCPTIPAAADVKSGVSFGDNDGVSGSFRERRTPLRVGGVDIS